MAYVKKTYAERLKNKTKPGKRINIIITMDIKISQARKELFRKRPYKM